MLKKVVNTLKKELKFPMAWSVVSQKESVTKFLDVQLKFLRLLGLINLPGNFLYGKFCRRHSSTLQRFYMGFTFVFFAVMLTASILGVVFKMSNDFIVFFTTFMEDVALLMVFADIIFLNLKRNDLLKLLNQMNKFDTTTRPSIITTCRQLERIFYFALYGTLLFVIAVKFIYPFLPISSEEASHLQAIYGFSHPQNRLPHFLWLPFLDTSEPLWFTFFYILNIYWSALDLVLGTAEAVLFPSILLHLVGQHFVLSKHLKLLGMSSSGNLTRPSQDPRKKVYDLFQVRKCVVIHRRLLSFRTLFDSVTVRAIRFRIICLVIITSLSAYPITILSQFEIQQQGLLVAEFIIILSFYYYNCLMSEVLEWANCLIRASIYQSHWYDMCPDAQRMMLMFLRRTQRPHMIRSLGGMVELGNENFLKTCKMIYSFLRFVNMVKRK